MKINKLLSSLSFPPFLSSYDEALQALADSEAKRETAERELKIVSHTIIHLYAHVHVHALQNLNINVIRLKIKWLQCGRSLRVFIKG